MNRLMLVLAFFALYVSGACAGTDGRKYEVTFDNVDVSIRGTAILPAGDGPHPGMVMVGGSGPSDRSGLMEIAEGFARSGVAVLVYDKRGTGSSGGNWVTSSLYDLAGDAAAAFSALANHAAVDPERVGYWGVSQGGWIVPIAAGRTPAAFAIVISGGGLAPREVETRNYLSIVEGVDESLEAGREVRQLLDDYFAYLGGEQPRDALMHSVAQYRDRPWFAATGIENVIPSEVNRNNWAWVAIFQPGPSITAMKAPVLVLLGGLDPLTPAERTAQAWREALPEADPRNRVVIVPEAGHGLRSGPHGGALVADFYPLQLRWLTDNTMLSPRARVLLEQ